MNNRPLHFLLAPDSFKDSLSAHEICEAMAMGIRRVIPDARVTHLPLSDGGEGFTESMIQAAKGERVKVQVTGPLNEKLETYYGLLKEKRTAVMDMASASGLHLIPDNKRDPLVTTTFGTGEMIHDILDHDVDTLILGIGGSATHDLGCGLAQALGVRFLDRSGKMIHPLTGRRLSSVRSIDMNELDPRLADVKIIAACDVENPLLGPWGAAHTYARQKGADDKSIAKLEKGSEHMIDIMEKTIGKSFRNIPGAGAAGGLGAGLMAFLNATLMPGIKLMFDIVRFDELIKDVDYILTGEGKTDAQTLQGKTIWGVIQQAKKQNVPVIILSGQIDENAAPLHDSVQTMISICPESTSLQTALTNTKPWMTRATEQVIRSMVSLVR